MNTQPTNEPKPQRTTLGKVIKWLFIGFNVFMLIWLVGGLGSTASDISEIQDDDSRAAASIGAGIGTMALIFLWLAGAVILGMLTYFTRARR